MNTKVVRPSSSYKLTLPENICDQSDGRITSFWVNGSPLLLQLSSYLRETGEQVPAGHRLTDRISKHAERWKNWARKTIHPDPTVDQALAEFVDKNQVVWIHCYLVWPHLTIYATISGSEELVRDEHNWALQALQSIQIITH